MFHQDNTLLLKYYVDLQVLAQFAIPVGQR